MHFAVLKNSHWNFSPFWVLSVKFFIILLSASFFLDCCCFFASEDFLLIMACYACLVGILLLLQLSVSSTSTLATSLAWLSNFVGTFCTFYF